MSDKLQSRMTVSEWRRDWFSTISFTSFIAISITMISLTLLLFVNLSGAIDHLMSEAKTPSFLQMHTGQINEQQLETFVQSRKDIEEFQVCKFLNLDNCDVVLGNQSLIESSQDNGLSVQGDGFDLLLDLNDQAPQVMPGQVYVPICYQEMYDVAIGDSMKIKDETLLVAGFMRDAQMNSMMASSKRFLVSKEDYKKLSSLGQEEYLIEFLLKDDSDITAFRTAYENAHLPMNGPTITKPLINMMNTLSDGIVIIIILSISLLVLLVSMVCIRFMLLIRMTAESGEIGILKAIGLSSKMIQKLFVRRYTWLIMIGSSLGVVISMCLYNPLSSQIQKLYGVSLEGRDIFLVSLLGAIVLGVVILLFVMSVLKKLGKMTALSALSRKGEETKKHRSKVCIVIVSAIAVFLMMIPSNLFTTMSSKKFVTYMGIGDGEIRMDLRQGDNIKEESNQISEILSQDKDILKYALYQTSSVPVTLSDGTTMKMLMERGKHTIFPVAYSQGSTPKAEGEVAISYLLAEELQLSQGDHLLVHNGDQEEECTVTGIYSDITNGGKTAKLYSEQPNKAEDVMWSIVYVTLKDNVDKQAFMDKYSEKGLSVVDIGVRVKDTYGPTINQIQRASLLAKAIGTVIILLVITTFIRLMIANERTQISIQKAVGFRAIDIKKNYWKSCIPYVIVGILVGGIAGCFLGEKLCGVALQSLGANGFEFVLSIRSIMGNLLVATVAIVAAIYIGTMKISDIKAVECCRGKE